MGVEGVDALGRRVAQHVEASLRHEGHESGPAAPTSARDTFFEVADHLTPVGEDHVVRVEAHQRPVESCHALLLPT
jgi:hypothetical protein